MENKNYKIRIKGMHCNACKILIMEELEENGLTHVEVNLKDNSAIFSSRQNNDDLEEILNKSFLNLKTYSYYNLKQS